MAFRTPQTGREMPKDYGDAVNEKFIYSSFRHNLDRVIADISSNESYTKCKSSYAIVTSFVDNSSTLMTYQLIYRGKPLLRKFYLRIRPIKECTYAVRINEDIERSVVAILEVEVPDFSLVHLHPHMSAIADDPQFFSALRDVVGMAATMVVDPSRVHVVILQVGGTVRRNILQGLNGTYGMALRDYCRFFSPMVDEFVITTNAFKNIDKFIAIHKNCTGLLHIMDDMMELAEEEEEEEEEDDY